MQRHVTALRGRGEKNTQERIASDAKTEAIMGLMLFTIDARRV